MSVLIGMIILIPLLIIFFSFFHASHSWNHILENILFSYLLKTVILVIGVSILSSFMGIASAWLITNYNFPGSNYIKWMLILPLAIPTYISAYAYSDTIEFFTPLLIFVRDNFGSDYMALLDTIIVYLTAIFVLSSVLYPYIYLLLRVSFETYGNHFIKVSNTLGYSKKESFWKIALPMSRPALVAGLILVTMETLSDFGAVKHFGIQTFTYGIFRTWFGMGDMVGALKLALALMIITLSFLYLEQKNRSRSNFSVKSFNGAIQKEDVSTIKAIFVGIFCLIPLILGFAIPIFKLGYWFIISIHYIKQINIITLIYNTIILAFSTSLITVLLSLFIIFSAKYYRNTMVERINKVSTLGYSIPGAVIAMGVIVLVGFLSNNYGIILSGSLIILLYGFVIKFIAVAYQPIKAGFEKQSINIISSSRILGSSSVKSLFKINIPIIKNSIISAFLLVFIDSAKELPLTLILRPFNFETLSTVTYDLSNQSQIIESSIPSFFIILIVILPIVFLNKKIEPSK